MLSPKYYIYFSRDKEGRPRSGASADPSLDASWLAQSGAAELFMLQPPQPLWLAEWVLAEPALQRAVDPERAARRGLNLLREFQPKIKLEMERRPCASRRLIPEPALLMELKRLLTGRSLLLTELVELLTIGAKFSKFELEQHLQQLVLAGEVERWAAVGADRLGSPYCRRCGSADGISNDDCYFCGRHSCHTCSNCRELGIAKGCIPLYAKPISGKSMAQPGLRPRLDFELTPVQQRAATQLEKFGSGSGREFLVWAVCGAGKTEISLGLIAGKLASGQRVLYAIPRKDVVQELLPRFRRAFPEVEIAALFGGSDDRITDARLVLATTHQAIRLYRAFDLVVLDEADAYPYHGCEMLHFAVRRALTESGQLVIMTATPDQPIIQRAHSGKLPHVTIPARYHRRPLIVPEFWKINSRPPDVTIKNWEPHPRIAGFLREAKARCGKMLIFLPTIPLVEAFGAALCKWGRENDLYGEWVHARHGSRLALKEELLGGGLDFLVTSTVFERGLTIPGVDILVLAADFQRVFNTPTLIQIAGRAGRKGEAARVVFAAPHFTTAMQDCRKWIIRMNREGHQLGFLD